jgi:hypothetical protein
VEPTQEDASIGQAGEGWRETGVSFKRLLKILDGRSAAFQSPIIQNDAPLQVGCIRLGIDRPSAALTETRGRVSGPSGAAAKLGIPPSNLESKIRAMNINKYHFKAFQLTRAPLKKPT